MIDNVAIRLIRLPSGVHGFTIYDGIDDYYNVYINENDTIEKQKNTADHEISHIIGGDFGGGMRVSDLELALV